MMMGTASTMTSVAEALGLTLPGAASIPAADSNHSRMASYTGPAHRRDGVGGLEAERSSDARNRSTTRSSTAQALSGSTNALIHLIAMAGRAGVKLALDRFDELVAQDAGARQHPARRQNI